MSERSSAARPHRTRGSRGARCREPAPAKSAEERPRLPRSATGAARAWARGPVPAADADVLLDVRRFEQPDNETCGPACLRAVYAYYGLEIDLSRLVEEVPVVDGGGTVSVYLGLDALSRGFETTIHTFSLRVFDPTWRGLDHEALLAKLERRALAAVDPKMRAVTEAYTEFLRRDGVIELGDLTPELVHGVLAGGTPVITGLCSTYLYDVPRVRDGRYDDVGGMPEGHFVVVRGSSPSRRTFVVSDPSRQIPFSADGHYEIEAARLVQAILIGDSTYDAVFLTVRPRAGSGRGDRSLSVPDPTPTG